MKIAGDHSGGIIRTQIVNNYCAAGSDAADRRLLASQVGACRAWLQERTQGIELRRIERAGQGLALRLAGDARNPARSVRGRPG